MRKRDVERYLNCLWFNEELIHYASIAIPDVIEISACRTKKMEEGIKEVIEKYLFSEFAECNSLYMLFTCNIIFCC